MIDLGASGDFIRVMLIGALISAPLFTALLWLLRTRLGQRLRRKLFYRSRKPVFLQAYRVPDDISALTP